jgi:hypothetical protein
VQKVRRFGIELLVLFGDSLMKDMKAMRWCSCLVHLRLIARWMQCARSCESFLAVAHLMWCRFMDRCPLIARMQPLRRQRVVAVR